MRTGAYAVPESFVGLLIIIFYYFSMDKLNFHY